MENITRLKEVLVAAAIAGAATAAVIVARAVGAYGAAAFFAGAGIAGTAEFVIIANMAIARRGRR